MGEPLTLWMWLGLGILWWLSIAAITYPKGKKKKKEERPWAEYWRKKAQEEEVVEPVLPRAKMLRRGTRRET